MDAVERRQQILELLCQRRKDTMQNLAAELGVSERTIRRDVEILTRSYHAVAGRSSFCHVVSPPRLFL